MALTAAVCVVALAVAVVLFFDAWWAGLIALGVSMLGCMATVLLFMTYKAERRRGMCKAQEEAEDARIAAMLESAPEKRGALNAAMSETASADVERGMPAQSEKEEKMPADGKETSAESISVDGENVDDKGVENADKNADDKDEPTTLEMRPPLRLFTVEEAKARMKGGETKGENDATDDKN